MAQTASNGYHKVATICVCGAAMRTALCLLGMQPMLEGALELIVPSTSWERAKEGLFLGSMGLSHYAGGVFSGSPLMLAAAAVCVMLPAGIQTLGATLLFTAFDVANALLLRVICTRAVAVESCKWETELEEWMDKDTRPAGSVKNSGGTSVSWQKRLPDLVVAVYLLNPILAAQCAALSGDVLGRVFVLAALAAAGRVSDDRQSAAAAMSTAAALAGAACLWRFHAAALLLPAALMLKRGRVDQTNAKDEDTTEENACANRLRCERLHVDFDTRVVYGLCAQFAAACAVVLGVCWLCTSRSWAFLRAAAGGQLLCEDLTPNAGLYWYFFAEVFPRFRGFFRVLFLSHPYVYVLPATLRLGMFPEATATLLLAIFGFFQPYPTLADPVVAGCLFLCHPCTAQRMRLVIPVTLAAVIPSLLLPTMRHLWLQAGTGNANFYYFQTVALNVLLSMLVLQFAAALVKRRKALALAFEKRRRALAGDSCVGKYR